MYYDIRAQKLVARTYIAVIKSLRINLISHLNLYIACVYSPRTVIFRAPCIYAVAMPTTVPLVYYE